MRNEEFNLIITVKDNKLKCTVESIGRTDINCLDYVNKAIRKYRKSEKLSKSAFFMKIMISQAKEGYHGLSDCNFGKNVVSKLYFGCITDLNRTLREL